MMDVSDGLLRDAGRIGRASRVRLDVHASALSQWCAALAGAAAARRADPLTWVLTGGEDHGLLATFPPGIDLPRGFVPVGRVDATGEPGVVVDGEPYVGVPGWDHFGGR